MKKINLAISGCLGRMGQQLIESSKKNKKFREIENEKSNPSIKQFFQKAKSFWKN